MTNTHYIVQHSSAKMPSSCKGQYRRVAILEVEEGVAQAPMISERAKGVVRVVQTWENLSAKGTNTAFTRALAEATAKCEQLNSTE